MFSVGFNPAGRLVVLTTLDTFTAAANDFTAMELDHLASWTRANRLEIAYEIVGSDLANQIVYIGLGFGMTSWVIQRCIGRLWLSLVGDRAGRRCTGWSIAVNSIEEATARIAGMLATGWR